MSYKSPNGRARERPVWRTPGISFLVILIVSAGLASQAAISEAPRAMAVSVSSSSEAPSSEVRELVDLANGVRSDLGLQPVLWDTGLATAAQDHALQMGAGGPISHRYAGEADLAERAAMRGAHFSLVEENIAAGSSTQQIHAGWMHSKGHRENLLNPAIDRIGVAVVRVRGVLYAVADYSKFVPSLSLSQVETRVGDLLRRRGLGLDSDHSAARRYCSLESGGLSDVNSSERVRFGMLWQSSDLSSIPRQMEDRMATGGFHRAAVGGCAPKSKSAESYFSAYRVAVLLY